MNEKIMIVDDDENICELLRLYLTKEGYTTVIVNDGLAAVETVATAKPALVLLDIMLPKLDGWQVTEDPKYMFLITDKKRNRVFGIAHDGTVEYDKGMSKEVRDRLAELRGWHYEVNEEYIFAITDKKRNLFLGIKRKNGRVVTPHGVVEVMDWQEYENTEVEAGVVYVIQGTDGCVEGCYIGGKPLRTGEEYAYFTEGNVLMYNGRLTSTPKIHVDYETMRLMIEYPVGYEGPVFEVIDGILFAR